MLLYQADNRFSFTKRKHLNFPLHLQEMVEIVFVIHGSCQIRCGDLHTQLRAGDVLVVFPNVLHEYTDSQDMEVYVLIVPTKAYLSEFYNILKEHRPADPVLRSGMWDKQIMTIVESAFHDFRHVADTVMHGYLTVIFGKLLENLQLDSRHTVSERPLQRVLTYINSHYRENITRKEIAKAAGYNESYISRLFTHTMKLSLPEYIHNMRIEDACHMLTETDISVSQISSELGFNSIRNFNRVFHKVLGMTPSQYRDNTKK